MISRRLLVRLRVRLEASFLPRRDRVWQDLNFELIDLMVTETKASVFTTRMAAARALRRARPERR